MEPNATVEALLEELVGHVSDAPQGSSDLAFRRLLNAILSLDLKPGSMLSERELMELADCSRAALRPAVIRLGELGLLRALPRKGLVVAPLDGFDASTIYEARGAIEGPVARLAAARARDEDVERLAALADHHVGEAMEPDWRSFLQHDLELHLAIGKMAGNPYLLDALARILPLASRLWHWVYQQLADTEHVRFEHGDIVTAIRERDPDAAEEAAAEHVRRARTMLNEVLVTRIKDGAR
ncbi:MAG: GntR family transcriptional regulator [Nitriliruptorales bacterium]